MSKRKKVERNFNKLFTLNGAHITPTRALFAF